MFRQAKARESTNNHAILLEEQHQVLRLRTNVYANEVALGRQHLEAERFKFRSQILDTFDVEFESLLDVFLVGKSGDCSHLGSLVHIEGRLDFPHGLNHFGIRHGVTNAEACETVNLAESTVDKQILVLVEHVEKHRVIFGTFSKNSRISDLL